nr:hypothetical protein [Saprospiraceae bacterium]
MKFKININQPIYLLISAFLVLCIAMPYSCKKAKISNKPPDCSADSFVLLESESLISINRLRGEQIEVIKEFEINEHTHYAYDGCHYLILADSEERNIKVYHWSGRFYLEEEIPLEIEIVTVFTEGKNVFIGGYPGESKFLQFNIQNREWHFPHIPEILNMSGKAIDDFVIHNNQLIAIDNIYTPKYFLFYDLMEDAEVEYKSKFLHRNLQPEYITKAEISPDFLGVLSTTASGWVGYYTHVVIYPLSNMEEEVFALPSKRFDQGSEGRIVDFRIYGNEIVFAHTKHGIGRIYMDEEFFHEEMDIFKWDYEFYEPYIEYIELEGLVSLTSVPDAPYFIATTLNAQEEYEHRVFPL